MDLPGIDNIVRMIFRDGTVRRSVIGLTVLSLAAAMACSSAAVQTHFSADADLEYYEQVGVVPFRSLAADRLAGEKVTVEFVTALFASDLFDVIDYGIFVHGVAKVTGSRSPTDGVTAKQLRDIAKETGVQGVFEGTVSHYETFASGNNRFPVISLEVRLLDAATGRVVWSATVTERGGPKTPLIGIGEVRTLGELSQKVCRRLVEELE